MQSSRELCCNRRRWRLALRAASFLPLSRTLIRDLSRNVSEKLSALFAVIDVRRADVRRETVQFRRSAWCDICGVAMGYGPWAMGFNLSAARHYVVIGAFGALRCARLLFCRHPGL